MSCCSASSRALQHQLLNALQRSLRFPKMLAPGRSDECGRRAGLRHPSCGSCTHVCIGPTRWSHKIGMSIYLLSCKFSYLFIAVGLALAQLPPGRKAEVYQNRILQGSGLTTGFPHDLWLASLPVCFARAATMQSAITLVQIHMFELSSETSHF